MRLKNIHLANQLKRIELTLRQKEELAEGLHLIDFEQLKIENQVCVHDCLVGSLSTLWRISIATLLECKLAGLPASEQEQITCSHFTLSVCCTVFCASVLADLEWNRP